MNSQSRAAPLVSVLVPAFNHQEYIEYCLESIAESTYAPLEIIVIDDGSSDNTYVRVCNWMENNAHRVFRVRVCQQTNRGLTRTLNALISLASGEYVTLVASDDALEPDGIALRVSALQNHPEWLAVFGDCSIIDDAGREKATSALGVYHSHLPALLNSKQIARELILRWSVSGPSMLVRSAAYDVAIGVGPYDERLQVEDRDFYLRLLSINALGFIPERVARYRLHGENSIFLRSAIIERDVVLSERRNITSFKGLNRFLLALVALRGRTMLGSAQQNERGNHIRGQMLWVVGQILDIAQRCAHLLNRLLSPPRGT